MAGDDDGHAERGVGDDVDPGDDPGALMRRRERETRRSEAEKAAPKPAPAIIWPMIMIVRPAGEHAADDAEGPGDGCVDADGHRAPGAEPGEHDSDDGRRRRSDEPAQPVEQAAVQSEDAANDGRGEAEGEAREHPDRGDRGRCRGEFASGDGGTATRGISERIAPGARVTVSGDSATTTMPRIVTIVSTVKMTVFAMAVNWMARPASSAPTARPPVMPTLPRMVPSLLRFGGASSTSAAVKALVAAPVATPCTIRAAITHPMPGARRNITIDAS